MRTIPTSLLVLVSAVVAGAPLHAQVKESQPFGGRPFGAQPGTPAPADTSGPGVPSGTAMGAPGVSSVTAPGTPNPGTPPSVLITPMAVPAPPPPAPPPPPPAPAPAPAPAPSAGHQGASPGAAVQGTPTPSPSGAPAQATSVPSAAPAPAMSSAPAPASMAPPFAGANRNAPTVPASTAQQAPVRGLPADAPKLVISGSVYSPDPAKRMLIVNGQMVREGADAGQGVVVHEVKPESAVLGFKGNNYTVVF
jgi:general secretion pathway protein B